MYNVLTVASSRGINVSAKTTWHLLIDFFLKRQFLLAILRTDPQALNMPDNFSMLYLTHLFFHFSILKHGLLKLLRLVLNLKFFLLSFLNIQDYRLLPPRPASCFY